MKYYLNGVGIFLFLCFSFGYAIPSLVSAKDTILFLLGLLWIPGTPVILYYWLRLVFFKKKTPVTKEV